MRILFFIFLVALSACTADISSSTTEVDLRTVKYEDFDIFEMKPTGLIAEGEKEPEHYVVVGYDGDRKINRVELIDRSIAMTLLFEPTYDSLADCYLWRHSDAGKLGEPAEDYAYIKNGLIYDYHFCAFDSIMFLDRFSITNRAQQETWTAPFPFNKRMPDTVNWDYCHSLTRDSLSYRVQKFVMTDDDFIVRGNMDSTVKEERYHLPRPSFLWYMYLGMYYEE
jgi:hypothetical protein